MVSRELDLYQQKWLGERNLKREIVPIGSTCMLFSSGERGENGKIVKPG